MDLAQRIQCLVVFQLPCVKMSNTSSHIEPCFQTEKIHTKVPDSCVVFIVPSLMPNDLAKVVVTPRHTSILEPVAGESLVMLGA